MSTAAPAGAIETASDRELVAAVRAGQDTAFEELYRRYGPRIAGYVRGMIADQGPAEDVTQEVFLSALRRLRATEAEIVFRPWIFEIAKNAAIDLYRRTTRAEEISIEGQEGMRPTDQLRLVGRGAHPETVAIRNERFERLRGALDELSESHMRILVLRELEGLSYREIGDRMELTKPGVESTLFRARRRLQVVYSELDSGARCAAMSDAIGRVAKGSESTRDRRRLGRHLRRCGPCQRLAHELGVEDPARTHFRSRVAALLPLPALLRRRREGDGADAPMATTAHGRLAEVQYAASSWIPSVAVPAGENVAGMWGQAAAVVVGVALAASGAATVDTEGTAGSSAAASHAAPSVKRASSKREAKSTAAAPKAPVVTRAPVALAPRRAAPARPHAAPVEQLAPAVEGGGELPSTAVDEGNGSGAQDLYDRALAGPPPPAVAPAAPSSELAVPAGTSGGGEGSAPDQGEGGQATQGGGSAPAPLSGSSA